jgi:hypothetical protein
VIASALCRHTHDTRTGGSVVSENRRQGRLQTLDRCPAFVLLVQTRW